LTYIQTIQKYDLKVKGNNQKCENKRGRNQEKEKKNLADVKKLAFQTASPFPLQNKKLKWNRY